MSKTMDGVNIASQAITIPVSARVFLGYSVEDWVLMGTACLLILNLLWVSSRVYEFYWPRLRSLLRFLRNAFKKKA